MGQTLRNWCAATCAVVILAAVGCGASLEADPEQLLDKLNQNRQRHDPQKYVEVELGEFLVTHRQPPDNETLVVEFQIFGVLDEGQTEEFKRALQSRKQRMREGVIATVLRTEAAHLRTANLGWMKAELISEINRRLRTHTLRDVVFTSYSLDKP